MDANADCTLPHPIWVNKTCAPARNFGSLRLAWGALLSKDKTVKAHCLSSPKLPGIVRTFLAARIHSFSDYHLRDAFLSNTALTRADVLRICKNPKASNQLKSHPSLLSLPGVAEYYVGQDLGRTDWFATVEGLDPVLYERLAEDVKTWSILASNPSTPADVLRLILSSTDSAEVLWAIKNPNFPVEDLVCFAFRGVSFDEEVLNAMEQRSEEVSAWIQSNHPEFADVPFEWVRQVLAGARLAHA